MRWAVPLAALGLLTTCGGRQPAAQGFDGEQAYRWAEAQVHQGPRVPGTAAHRRTGDWLIAELSRRADTVEVQSFEHVTATGDTLRLRNILARFLPQRPDRVLYVAHWDTRPRADQDSDPSRRALPIAVANAGASGGALLRGGAEALRRRPPAVGVDLLLVDGEDYGEFDSASTDVLIGSRYFAARLPATLRPLFAVVWDMVADRDQQFYYEGYSLERAPEVVERVWSKAEELGLGGVFRPRRVHYLTDDHIPLLDAGIRAIDVIDFDYPFWHTTQDTMDKISAESLARVGRVALALVR